MSITVFNAAGFVFLVNNETGAVAQFTQIEALLVAAILRDCVTDAMIELILSGDESLFEVAGDYADLADAIEFHTLKDFF